MPTALVTGANRGIGLEHVRQFAARGWTVLATARDPAGADELNALAGERVRVLAYDAAKADAPAALKAAIGDVVIDVLVNNAGVIGVTEESSAGTAGASQSFDGIAPDNMLETFRINSVAPLMLSRALLANIEAGEKKLIAMQSSQMGSIADTSAGYYAYRASKAALNMITKAMAGDLKARGVTVITLHPGWVQTRMGGAAAPLSVEDSVKGEQALFDRVGPADTGKFFRYSGEELAW